MGSSVIKVLISKGVLPTITVRKLSKYSGRFDENKVRRVEIDLLDGKQVERLFQERQFDRIVHLAGTTGRKLNRKDDLGEINYAATAQILDLAAQSGVRRIVITGTADEYGSQPAPQSENLLAQPVTEYARSKNEAVNHALSLYEKYRLPIVVLRPFTVYGIGQPERMFISQAVDCAVKNIGFEMSQGVQKRDLLFVEDFADAMMKALTADGIDGEIFNVGSGKSFALAEIAEKIWRLAGAHPNLLKIGARRTDAHELYDTEADISKISRVLQWQPKVSLDEGLKYIVESFGRKVK